MISFKTFIQESKKASKEEAGYQDSPKNGEKCINCTMWRDPNKCSAVAGIISSNGWCEWYSAGAYGKKGKLTEDANLISTFHKLKKLFPLVSDTMRIKMEKHIDTLSTAAENKFIYNARFEEAKFGLNTFLNRAYSAAQASIIDYRKSNPEVSKRIPYTIYDLTDLKKTTKNIGNINDFPSQIKEFFDTTKDVPDAMAVIKGYVQKGKAPREVKPGEFVKPAASYNATKAATEFMQEATDSFKKKLKENITSRITKVYENIRDITDVQDLPKDETSHLVASRIFVTKSKEGKKYFEKLSDANERVMRLIEDNVDQIVNGFVAKNSSKLALILQKKGKPKSHEIVNTNIRNGMVENTMRFVFEDSSSFTLESSVIYKYSQMGKFFFQYPTRFKNVRLADGTIMKMPSEKKMIEDF